MSSISIRCVVLGCALWLIPLAVSRADDAAPAGDVPKGEVVKHSFAESKIFPGTVRDYWIYVPKQYDPAKPACLYVNQDGVQYFAPQTFDYLIAKKEMPVTIGVFIAPGKVPAVQADALDRFNRSIEYDTPDGTYARFLIEEMLPAVEREKSSDGREIKLSHDPNERAIAGASSGAICAFTVAWERPDAFRRVFSTIGTYVGLRGGDCYPTLIRKTEPKPLRVFLQDGSGDLNNYGGDWWMANQTMERAFVFSGYEVNHAWGEGGHNQDDATKVFADAMRWLWKDWPNPPKIGAGSPQMQELLVPDEPWKVVAEGSAKPAGPAVQTHGLRPVHPTPGGALAANSKGEIIYCDPHGGKLLRIALDGKIGPSESEPNGTLAFDADGQLVTDAHGTRLLVRHDGSRYLTGSEGADGKLLLFGSENGATRANFVVPLGSPTGLALSPDQSLLYVADGHSHWIWSYQLATDGTPTNGQRFHCLHVPEWADSAETTGLAVDRTGRLYCATNMGIQVCDQAGRVNAILPLPSGRAADLCFGGEGFRTLFVTCGDRVYSRKLKVEGAQAFAEPIKPAPPRL